MRKYLALLALIIFTANPVFAQSSMPTEQDYKNLDQMRSKLVRMKREMDKFVKEIVSTTGEEGANAIAVLDQNVRVDVSEDDKAVTVKVDLPGMDKDRINIALENSRILKISGERDAAGSQSAPGMVKQERMYGKFERVVELPSECMNSGIGATYKNGVLEVVIPKKKTAKDEVVKIKVQ